MLIRRSKSSTLSVLFEGWFAYSRRKGNKHDLMTTTLWLLGLLMNLEYSWSRFRKIFPKSSFFLVDSVEIVWNSCLLVGVMSLGTSGTFIGESTAIIGSLSIDFALCRFEEIWGLEADRVKMELKGRFVADKDVRRIVVEVVSGWTCSFFGGGDSGFDITAFSGLETFVLGVLRCPGEGDLECSIQEPLLARFDSDEVDFDFHPGPSCITNALAGSSSDPSASSDIEYFLYANFELRFFSEPDIVLK